MKRRSVDCRNPDATRERLLQAAFTEIYKRGYIAASVDRIVEESGLTKGALYHHFGSKKGLARAVIDSIISRSVVDSFLSPLGDPVDPIDAIKTCITTKIGQLTPEMVACGCPLNNLAQELSASDDDFREQIEALYERWRMGLTDVLARGQREGSVRHDVDAIEVATFIVATLSGIAGFAKSARSVDVARRSTKILLGFLDTLRVQVA